MQYGSLQSPKACLPVVYHVMYHIQPAIETPYPSFISCIMYNAKQRRQSPSETFGLLIRWHLLTTSSTQNQYYDIVLLDMWHVKWSHGRLQHSFSCERQNRKKGSMHTSSKAHLPLQEHACPPLSDWMWYPRLFTTTDLHYKHFGLRGQCWVKIRPACTTQVVQQITTTHTRVSPTAF